MRRARSNGEAGGLASGASSGGLSPPQQPRSVPIQPRDVVVGGGDHRYPFGHPPPSAPRWPPQPATAAAAALSPPPLLQGTPVVDTGAAPPPQAVLQPDLLAPGGSPLSNGGLPQPPSSARSCPGSAAFTFGQRGQQQQPVGSPGSGFGQSSSFDGGGGAASSGGVMGGVGGMQQQQYVPPAKRRRTMEAAFGDLTLRNTANGPVGSAAAALSPPVRDAASAMGGGSSLHSTASAPPSIGVGAAAALTVAEETIDDDNDEASTPWNPQDVVVDNTSIDSSSDTDAGMDDATDLPDIGLVAARAGVAASRRNNQPSNPVDERIEEIIRASRLKAMVRARLEAEGKQPPPGSAGGGVNGGSGAVEPLRTRDDFELQGTFETAGSLTRPQQQRVQQYQQQQQRMDGAIPPASASASASAARATTPVMANASATTTTGSTTGRVPAGVQRGRRGRDAERGSRQPRSRSLPRQLEAGLSRDASSASKASASSVKAMSSSTVSMATSSQSDMDM